MVIFGYLAIKYSIWLVIVSIFLLFLGIRYYNKEAKTKDEKERQDREERGRIERDRQNKDLIDKADRWGRKLWDVFKD